MLYRDLLLMRAALIALTVAAAACAAPGASPVPLPRAPDYSPSEIRRPAIFVRVAGWPDLNDREREALADTYEGALVEAFDDRGFPPTDVRRVTPDERLDPRTALARAREVRADHVLLVDLKVSRRDAVFCPESRRPFRAITTVWSQGVQVLRVSDGASRIAVAPGQGLDVTEIQADCANPRRSELRDRAAMVAAAVHAVTERVLGR